MPLKAIIEKAMQDVAEAIFVDTGLGTVVQRGALRLAFGTPGVKFQFRGETREAGRSYIRPGSIDCMIEGLVNSLGKARSSPMRNDDAGAILLGEVVRVVPTGFRGVKPADTTDPSSLLGVALEQIDPGVIGEIGTVGEVVVRLRAGETPVNGELVGLSATSGRSKVVVTEVDAFGVIVDTTGYVDPSNRLVSVVLMMRPRV